MALLIPCTPGTASRWSQRTSLAGRDYVLSFDWLERAGQWRMSIADQDGSPIREGIALVTARRLLGGVVDARRPPGELVVVDTLNLYDLDPGFSDLGARFALAYLDPSEVPDGLV